MKRIEFIGTAGVGKTSIYHSLDFERSMFGSRDDLILFASRCVCLEKAPFLKNFLGAVPQSIFDRLVKKLVSRDQILRSILNEKSCVSSSRLYDFVTGVLDCTKVRPEPFRARCALLLAGEKYKYLKIPVFDEGLLGCIKDVESLCFERALDELLGVVHIDSDPVSLLAGLKKRVAAGNFKGARMLSERSEKETLKILDSRLRHIRNIKAALIGEGVPVVSVNYHANPLVAKKQANDFLGSLDATD